MRYLGFFFSLIFTLCIALGLSINLASLPPLANIFDPFRGFWQNAYSEDHKPKTSISLPGLIGEVTVEYDQYLIPHIYASHEEDLYRVQGYITARHRLWQMEFQVLAAAGRLSEIVGEIALDYDRQARRKGLTFGAENKVNFLEENDPQTLSYMEAYAEGVNAYIDQMSFAEMPVEYKLLDYTPEHWSPYKTCLFLMNMADMLARDRDLEFTNLRILFGEEWMQGLFPDWHEGIEPVIASEKWDFKAIPVSMPENIIYPDSFIVSKILPQSDPGFGSNNWAVAGSKTKKGRPILASDPHLGLNIPSLWFAIQLSTDDFTVKGGSLPGALGVIIGFNENIAWGPTNADRDVKDWYAISFKDESRSEYLYNDQWIPTTIRLERIGVKNGKDFMDTVIYTHHGPVVYDRNYRAERKDVDFSLKWTAYDGSNEQRTFLLLNRAKDYTDFVEAMGHYAVPAQNFAFASASGDIAMRIQGKFPLKWEGQGKYLMDGKDPDYEWLGYVPVEHNPSVLNPSRGFVSSANQHPVDRSYPYYVFGDQFEHYRNRRINQMLEEMDQITVEDMMTLQNDNYHLHAAEILPTMLAWIQEEDLNGKEILIRKELERWDYFTDPDQAGPSLFDSWWKHTEMLLGVYWDIGGVPVVYPDRYRLSHLLMADSDGPWFDDRRTSGITETAHDLVKAAFHLMVEETRDFEENQGDISWRSYKNTSISHLIPAFHSFSYTKLNIGGGKGIINATSGNWGPGWRMVVEPGDFGEAYGIFPGGQSGNPGSRFYDSFLEMWTRGEYVDITLKSKGGMDGLLYEMHFNSN